MYGETTLLLSRVLSRPGEHSPTCYLHLDVSASLCTLAKLCSFEILKFQTVFLMRLPSLVCHVFKVYLARLLIESSDPSPLIG